MGKLKTYQEQVQESFDKALKTVEEQHRTLAAKPFDYAEKLEGQAKELSIKSVREMHDKALDNLYSTFHSWNKRVSDYTNELVAKFDKEEEKAKKAPAKRKTTAKKAAKKETTEEAMA